MTWKNMITLGRCSIEVNNDTDDLCNRIKDKGVKLGIIRSCSASAVLRPILMRKLLEIEKQLDEMLNNES